MEPLLIVGVVILIAVAVYFSWRQKKKRQEAFAAFAQAHGLRYRIARDHSFDDHFTEFECLRKGSGRYAYNIIDGNLDDREFYGFDYHYETHSTGSKGRRQTHHHHFTALILESPIPLKPLFIRPEGFFDKITEFFGFDDIDFESAEFSRKFYVKAKDKRWAYDVLHPQVMQRLLDSPKFQIDFDRRHAAIYSGSRLSIPEIETALKLLQGIYASFPEFLRRQQTESLEGQ